MKDKNTNSCNSISLTFMRHYCHNRMKTWHETFDHIPVFTADSSPLESANVWRREIEPVGSCLCGSSCSCLSHSLPECFRGDGHTGMAAFATFYLRSNVSWSTKTAANTHCSHCADSAHTVQAHVHCCLFWGAVAVLLGLLQCLV